MRNVDPLQGSLFEVDTPPVKVPRRRADNGEAPPQWSKYRPKNPVKCDDCMLLLVETNGDAPASRSARWRRRQGDSDLLLCYAHADVRRVSDGLESL